MSWILCFGCGQTPAEKQDQKTPTGPSRTRYVEVHTHFVAGPVSSDKLGEEFEAAAQATIQSMDRLGIRKCLLMPPPQSPDLPHPYDAEALAAIVKKYPERFGFLAGGGTLNPMIHRAAREGKVSDELKRRFEETAEGIVRAGALGFGEMAAEHFSFNESHPYLAVAPDHPLFLLLAEVAARRDVVIDLHMEPLVETIPFPRNAVKGAPSSRNPKEVRGNIQAFERLLSHNRKARIVLAHVGWEHTGHGTTALMRRLLESHSNLFMSLKAHPHSTKETGLISEGRVRAEWLKLIADFPDRFVLGADQFYAGEGRKNRFPWSADVSRAIVDQLSNDLSRKVAFENAERIYRLK